MTAKNSTGGRTSRRIIALSAVLAVAMFFTMPLAVAVGSDADYGTGDAGYTLEFDEKATNDELARVEQSRNDIGYNIGEEIAAAAGIDLTNLYVTDVSMDTLKCEVSKGEKVESGKVTGITSDSYDVKKFSVTLKSDLTTSMFDEDTISTKMLEAINAIKAYFGTNSFHSGDTVTITAESVSMIVADEQISEYGEKNDTQCLQSGQTNTNCAKLITKATIAYKPAGGTEKSITVDVNTHSEIEMVYTYVYGKDLKDVNNYDAITVKMKYTPKSFDYSLKITVDGTDYKVDDIKAVEEEMSSPAIAIVKEKSDVKVITGLKTFCDKLNDSENVKTTVGYDKAMSEYNSAVDDVSPSGGGNNIVLIVVIVVVILAVIGGVAFFIIKKKKA